MMTRTKVGVKAREPLCAPEEARAQTHGDPGAHPDSALKI